jgi:hypothetical protein
MRRALRKALGGVSQYRLQFTIPSTRRPRRLAPWILRICVFYIINKPDYPHSLQFTQSNSNGNLDFTSLRIGQIRRLNCNFVRSWIVFWTALSVPTHCCTQELGNFLNNVYERWADDTGTKLNKEHFPCRRKAWGVVAEGSKRARFSSLSPSLQEDPRQLHRF